MWRRPACQSLLEALDISSASATARVAPDLLKTLVILSDTTVRSSAVDRDGIKPYLKSENRPHFYRWPISLLLISFSKNLLTTEGTQARRQFSAVHLSSKFLNTGTNDETFQQSGKQDSFRHILNRSASMYGSPGSQFFTATTRIQSGPDAFYESRFIMNFLTILGIKKIYSFRLILERKAGKEIPSLQD